MKITKDKNRISLWINGAGVSLIEYRLHLFPFYIKKIIYPF